MLSLVATCLPGIEFVYTEPGSAEYKSPLYVILAMSLISKTLSLTRYFT